MSNPWAQQASSASAAQTNQSNNPFAPRAPTHREQAEQRFPAVEQQQQQQHEQGGASSSMLSPQQTAYGQQQYGGMQPQQTGYMQPQRTGFVPSSSFGQQLRAEMDMYGGPSPYQQQQQQSSFTGSGNFSGGSSGASQPVSQGVLSQFDPYAGLSALVDSQASSTSAPSAAQPSAAAQSAAQALPPAPSQPTMDVHPRDFVLQNKALLSSWNDPAWKALLAKFDPLREAWEAREKAAVALKGRGGDEQRVAQLERDAAEHVADIHAARFQLAEAYSGFRHSSDASSKGQVRDAMNGCLRALPDYPTPLAPENVGGAFAQNVAQEGRKSAIMSQFTTPTTPAYAPQQQQQQQQQQPQFTGAGYMQAQPTGFYGGQGMMQQGMPTGYGGAMQPQQGYMYPQATGFYPYQPGYQ